MAKKSRTPPPPRRPVQAPRARGGRPPDERRARLLLLGAAGLGFVGLGVAAALLLFARGGDDAAAAQATLREVGCSFKEYRASEGGLHVTSPPKQSEYNSFPPTSGPHHSTPAPWGVYDDPVEQYRLVHNLEHGGVAIQYGDGVPEADVDALLDWYRDNSTGLVVAPLPALKNRIALGAWTADVDATGEATRSRAYLAKCPRFDAGAFDTFVEEFAFRGPERVDPQFMQPGQ